MGLDFIYDTPNAIVLFIFILVFLALALTGLFIFTLFTENGFNKNFNDTNTGTYIAMVATAIAIVIAFLITSEYQTYQTTSLNLAREANAIYSLVEILVAFNTPEADVGITFATNYLCSIINVEFLLMQDGILPGPNVCLDSLQAVVLDLTPANSKQIILYDKAIDQLDLAINLRNYRLEQTIASLPAEFWWLLIIGVSILIVLTWFINGPLIYRVIMTSLVTTIYSVLIALIFLLNLPFRGFFALSDSAFRLALNELGFNPANCPPGECSPIQSSETNTINKQNMIKNKVSSCIKSSKEINLM